MPSLFLSAATATRRTVLTLRPKLAAPTIQVSQISFVFWLVKPVRLKRLARFWPLLAPMVAVERSTIRPGSFSSAPAANAPGKGAWFWWAVGPVSWNPAPLAARLGYRRARSTKKPLLSLPATSPARGDRTVRFTAGFAGLAAEAEVALPATIAPATAAVAAAASAALLSLRVMLILLLCLFDGWVGGASRGGQPTRKEPCISSACGSQR